ncbi:MAG: hypothetical protein EOP04_19685, partial [Proteobacteria bacterium]
MQRSMIRNAVLTAAFFASAAANAQTILPMYNYALPSEVKSLGNKLFQGVTVDTVNDELRVRPSNTIYFEPAVAEVIGSDFSKSPAANCSVVEQSRIQETSIAETQTELVKLLAPKESGLDSLIKEQLTAEGQCTYYNGLVAADQARIVDLQNSLTTAKVELETSRSSLSICKLTASNIAEDCKDQVADVTNFVKSLTAASNELLIANADYGKNRGQQALQCSKAASALKQIDSTTTIIASIRGNIAKIGDSVNDTIVGFGLEYGGTAAASISNQAAKQTIALE